MRSSAFARSAHMHVHAYTHGTHTLAHFHNACYMICAQRMKACALNIKTAELVGCTYFSRPRGVLRAKATLVRF